MTIAVKLLSIIAFSKSEFSKKIVELVERGVSIRACFTFYLAFERGRTDYAAQILLQTKH